LNRGDTMEGHHTQKPSVFVRTRNSIAACLLSIVFLLTGSCSSVVDRHFQGTVDAVTGSLSLPGLRQPVTVRRDAFGIPYVEAVTMEDLAMAVGYVHASDRLSQMTGFRLMAKGRLAEMAGEPLLELDIYMRTLGLERMAAAMLTTISPRNRELLDRYCAGVNTYLDSHRDNLPPDLALARYTPEPWRPIDSALVFCLVNLALSFNVYEETAALGVAQSVGIEKAAWLLPVYPDEPLPFKEAAKLAGIDLKKASAAVADCLQQQQMLASLGIKGAAASNNWAIAGNRTSGAASILANDTHLMLTLPSMWNMMHLKCGTFDTAGITLAGGPLVVAGYNGSIAWGMTMVMADNQDLFLEQLQVKDGRLHYLSEGQWTPTTERTETFRVRGRDPVTRVIRETNHGPLLNEALRNDPTQFFQPVPLDLPYGVALQWAALSGNDKTFDSFFALNSARSVDEAFAQVKSIRSIALNMVFADRNSIGWQVTGNYPLRKKGTGFLPSPGWTGEYDWTGLLDPAVLPMAKNPPEGFIGTANNRTVGKDYPHVLSSSWYWPERAERIAQMISATPRHTLRTSMDMQLDTVSLFAPRLRDLYLTGRLATDMEHEVASWKDPGQRARVHLGLDVLEDFDGSMSVDSGGAALVSAILHCATRNIFLDELGPESSRTWKAFLVINNESYNATCDHILVRGDESPFWDDAATPDKETKARILARSLLDAVMLLEKGMGKDYRTWKWGTLHTYLWETESSRMAPNMGLAERTALRLLRPYHSRGPFPAPGDYFTLNVAGYTMGRDFDTWLIPAMRIIVDFSLDEPMFGVNSTGQSDNPSSPHFDDAITAWRQGKYLPFPFKPEAIRAQYRNVLVLTP
ncbi:MAG TPA: penicillin acylase family protein, partial [Deltaproteobacteria bacterium]|nr:penicillin acylase family protein [Deltaproteobacteria bacterium]